MAELVGKGTGVCEGKGGSLHLADFAVGCMGESRTVSSIPIAAVASLSARTLRNGRVVLRREAPPGTRGTPSAGRPGAAARMRGVQVWRAPEEVPEGLDPAVVSVGVFDGVHRGHRVVLDRAVARARAERAVAVAVTFDPHPVEVVRPGVRVPRLATLERRLALLGGTGVDAVLVLAFTPGLAALAPEEFAERVLRGRLHAGSVVVGAGFRFGHRARGDVALLERLGFAVEAVPLVPGAAGERVSSSAVRAAISEGRLADALAGLGHPWVLDGVVVPGDRRGRTLGYPTANVAAAAGLLLPADGVYAGRLQVGGAWLPAAVSVGANPTFGDVAERRVEAHVIDRDDLDLYGERVALELVARLRGMERFDGLDPLLAQMADDVAVARAVLAR